MKMYQVMEQGEGIRDTYMMGFETEEELTNWLEAKKGWHGNKYSIVAWRVNSEGFGWIDLEKIWNLYGKKRVAA